MTTVKVIAGLLLMMRVLQIAAADPVFNIVVVSPTPSDGTTPNTLVTTSDSIGSSLLGSGVPTLLWLSMSSADVSTMCQLIVSTGTLTFGVTMTDVVASDTEYLDIQVLQIGGCEAAPDASGTEAVFVDNYGRKSALVCPQNAGSNGCGVYLMSPGITQIYNEAVSGARKSFDVSAPTGLTCANITQLEQGGPLGTIIAGELRGFEDCLKDLGHVLGLLCLILLLPETIYGIFANGGCNETLPGCFPGDACVSMASGGLKRMDQLDIGDKVAVWKPDGGIAYEDVYAFGHRDAERDFSFYSITMAPSSANSATKPETRIELSGLHFAPISAGGISGQEIVYVRAQQIKVGDMMWAFNDNKALALHNVTGISISTKRGLYNPFTTTGTIIVNGVVASVHSDWFLDNVFETVGLTHLLPIAYQVMLTPPRLLYKTMGKNLYIVLYNWLDLHTNLVQIVSDYSGSAAALVVGCVVVAPFYLSKRSR